MERRGAAAAATLQSVANSISNLLISCGQSWLLWNCFAIANRLQSHTQRERERRGTQSTHDTELIKLPYFLLACMWMPCGRCHPAPAPTTTTTKQLLKLSSHSCAKPSASAERADSTHTCIRAHSYSKKSSNKGSKAREEEREGRERRSATLMEFCVNCHLGAWEKGRERGELTWRECGGVAGMGW